MLESLPAVLTIGFLVTMASLLGLLAQKVNFPRVVVYILVGVVFSPGLLGGILNFTTEGWSAELTEIALGIIAYNIGSEINLSELKKEEGIIFLTVMGQSLGALLFISLGVWGLGKITASIGPFNFYQAMIFGVVAMAAAPAALISLFEEHKAQGKMTNILLGIIPVDDAIGVLFFTLILGLGAEGSFSGSILEGLKEIGGTLFLGSLFGLALGYIGNRFKKEELRLATILGFVFLVFGISKTLHFSMLISCMTLGFVSVMFYPKTQAEWRLPLKHIQELVFIFFFTLAGIHFRIDVFNSALLLILIYIILRVIGKYLGAYAGLSLAGADKDTRRLLGLCLFPQAGVATGLAIQASNQPGFDIWGSLLINVILVSTIIFGLLSPFSTRFALKKAGEITISQKPESTDNQR